MHQIAKAIQQLKNGKIIALPTETVYGLAVDITNETAIENLFTLKSRTKQKPIAIAIATPNDLQKWALEIPATAKKLIATFWPGPLTLILAATTSVPTLITKNNRVGIRCSSCKITQEIIQQLGNPICLTSANVSGQKDALTAEQVLNYFKDIYVVEADNYINGTASTVIDCSKEPIELLREGAIQFEEITRVLTL